jgi:hypothetical protein
MNAPDGEPPRSFNDEAIFDLLRGVAALTGSAVVRDLAEVVARAPRADLAIAFNHKQIGSKLWLRDGLAGTLGPTLGRVLVAGGWLGVLAALLLEDPRLAITALTTLDRDPGCADVATVLNRRHAAAGRFCAMTADMYDFDYGSAGAPRFDLVINTSCEHIPDLAAWLALLPADTAVALQSNDYVREPDHVACVTSVEAFATQARLSAVLFRGERPTKNYRRFMLIGRT